MKRLADSLAAGCGMGVRGAILAGRLHVFCGEGEGFAGSAGMDESRDLLLESGDLRLQGGPLRYQPTKLWLSLWSPADLL